VAVPVLLILDKLLTYLLTLYVIGFISSLFSIIIKHSGSGGCNGSPRFINFR